MRITKYTNNDRTEIIQMLTDYFTEIGADIPEDIIRGKLFDLIEKQALAQTIHIAIISEDTIPLGFSIYQIDNPESDWCKKPGWGFIREFFIDPSYRRKGYGSVLLKYCQHSLSAMGADRFYLTSDEAAIAFWLACGWKNTGETSSNGLPVLEK